MAAGSPFTGVLLVDDERHHRVVAYHLAKAG